MTYTISNTITTGVSLSIASQNPLVIQTTGYVSTQYPYGPNGILGLPGTAWTITNHGTVVSGYNVIYLTDGGMISSNGTIRGDAYSFAAILTNGGPATVSNHGLISAYSNGVRLQDGGSVTNFVHGRIAATGGEGQRYYGVKIDGGGYVGNAGTITGYHFGVMLTGGGTVENSGRITGTANMYSPYANIGVGVYLAGGGTVINSGTISGLLYAVQFGTAQAARLVNTADAALLETVKGGSGSNTLELAQSTAGLTGTVDNLATFIGFQTIDVDAAANWMLAGATAFTGTLSNAGTLSNGITLAAASIANIGSILGDASAVRLTAAASVSNTGFLLGGSLYGVQLAAGGTMTNTGSILGGRAGVYVGGASAQVTNSGSIIGGVYAIQFETTLSARLVETADAMLSGIVAGGSLSNTLELAASTADQTGTIASVATGFTGFQTIDIDAGASWLIDSLGSFAQGGTIAFLGAGATVAFADTLVAPANLFGFAQAETIDFAGLPFVAGDSAQLQPGNTLEIDLAGGGSFDVDLDPNQDFTGQFFHLAAAGNTTMLTTDNMPCYCCGTHIRTPGGDIRVEALRIGDLVLTEAGAARPIRWIGTRCYEGRFIENNPAVLPIRIGAGALGADIPVRDLHVSPEHALFLDGALVPARLLCNGRDIVQLHAVERIDYFHIELDSHDILLAEGVPAESFVDCDSRAMFHNAHEFARLYPQQGRPPVRFCAERLEVDSPALEALRRRLTGAAQADRGMLRGRVDECDRMGVRGWACDGDGRVILRVLRDGLPVARAAAARPRIDLSQAKLGDCAFDISFSPPLDPACSYLIRVLRDEDGAELDGSPFLITAAEAFDAGIQARLARHVAEAAHDPALLDGMISWLVAQTEGLLQARVQRHDRVPQRPRALVLDDRLPCHGGGRDVEALIEHMRALSRLGFDVSFSPVQDASSNAEALAEIGVEVLGAPWYASVEEVLRRHAGRFELIYLHRAANAVAYGRLARHYCPQAQLIYAAAGPHPEESLAAWRADAVITALSNAADRLRRAVPGVAIHVVPPSTNIDALLHPVAAPALRRWSALHP